ncbi:helix-turn-helix domain-containing protein [Desulfitobacterium chlororespirans]|uniref:Helix-turn-helix n=1 Tax=Desulfitobacterium chlororespirans DSM 11544 TaxID=1121395 RepID=A0A1M7V011_9FIRM|nr:helix-turn-helix transcriptional regulator [Desulfitobacterium chlororespirans]SHN88534.1 Helix-turn-helix [Desulfitobacterium chlororespirans DSM 11544]
MTKLDAVQIGKNIALRREQLSLSVGELAQRAKLPVRSIHRIEAGERRPDIAALARVACALEIALEEVLSKK